MSMHYIIGDLLTSDCDYICHQVNCQGRMGSGIAKQIREKWPIVYKSYMSKYDAISGLAIKTGEYERDLNVSEILLGDIQIVNINTPGADERAQQVINMFAQQHYGYDGKRYTSYDAFWSCLGKIREAVPAGSKIGFPSHIGCGLGGANWKVIDTMIEEVLATDYDVYIYKLEV